jgi:hypothetical protein
MTYFSIIIDGYLVDLYEDESVQLNRQIKDYSKIDTVFTDFSQNFTIPATDNNNAIFQNFFDENVLLQSWNQNYALSSQIFIHGLPVFNGKVELLEVKFTDGLPSSYNIVFYGQGKNVLVEWGDKTLPEIDWSSYDHMMMTSLALSSWYGGLLGGSIVWDLKDYGLGYNWSTANVTNNIRKANTINWQDLRPSILLKDMITNIFVSEGFTLGGSLLSRSEFTNLYVTPMNVAGPYRNNITGTLYGNFVADNGGLLYNIFRPTNTQATWFTLPVGSNIVSGNTSGAWSTTNYEYTCPENGDYQFEIDIISYNPLPTTFTPRLSIKAVVNNKVYGYFRAGDSAYWAGSGPESFLIKNLNKGDIVKLIYNTPINATVNGTFSCTWSPPTYQVYVVMANVMPEIKVSEFFESVLQTFNAVLVPTGLNSFELHNIDDWYASGQNVEYTEFINFKSLTHKKMPIANFVSMEHEKGETIAQTFFANTYKREFGSVTFKPDVDFADEPIEFKTKFQINPVTILRKVNQNGIVLGDTDLEIPFLIDKEGKAIQQKLSLFYFCGVVPCSYQWYFGGIALNTYPKSSTFSANVSGGYSLGFGLENNRFGDMPANTLYFNFWNKYISRLYSTRSRIVIVDAVLPVGVWLNMKLNDNVAISGNYYKIQKIQYDLLSQQAVIELITYPNVNILQVTSTSGNKPTFNTIVGTDGGKTFIDGNPIKKGIGNAILQGGIFATDSVDPINMNNSLTYELISVRDNYIPTLSLNKVSVWWYNLQPWSLTPVPAPIYLGESGFEGDSSYYTIDFLNSQVTINSTGQYRFIGAITVDVPASHWLALYISIDDIETEAYQEVNGNQVHSVSLYGSATIGEGSNVQIRANTLDGGTHVVDFLRSSLIVERII